MHKYLNCCLFLIQIDNSQMDSRYSSHTNKQHTTATTHSRLFRHARAVTPSSSAQPQLGQRAGPRLAAASCRCSVVGESRSYLSLTQPLTIYMSSGSDLLLHPLKQFYLDGLMACGFQSSN
jgi:hypothetical protein